jgi:hypothetical protein
VRRRIASRCLNEALFAEISNAKRVLAPNPVMLPDLTAAAGFARYSGEYRTQPETLGQSASDGDERPK